MSVPLPGDSEARIIVRERLRLLTIGFYVRGGIMAAFSCFFLLYVFMFLAFSFIPESGWQQRAESTASPAPFASPMPTPRDHSSNPDKPPVIVFRIMAGVMGGFVLLGWTVAAFTAYAGRCIQQRRSKALIYVMAAANCLFIPYGTLLGVFTFVVLASPAAVEEFNGIPR